MIAIYVVLLLYLQVGVVWAFLYRQAMLRAARGEPKDDPDVEEARQLMLEKPHQIPLALLLIVLAWPYFRLRSIGE